MRFVSTRGGAAGTSPLTASYPTSQDCPPDPMFDIGTLPIAFTLYMLVARPSYILLLTKEPLGWLMIAGGVTAMVVGSLWMKKIVDVEV